MFREDNVDTVGLREKIDYKKNKKSLNGEEIFFFSFLKVSKNNVSHVCKHHWK